MRSGITCLVTCGIKVWVLQCITDWTWLSVCVTFVRLQGYFYGYCSTFSGLSSDIPTALEITGWVGVDISHVQLYPAVHDTTSNQFFFSFVV